MELIRYRYTGNFLPLIILLAGVLILAGCPNPNGPDNTPLVEELPPADESPPVEEPPLTEEPSPVENEWLGKIFDTGLPVMKINTSGRGITSTDIWIEEVSYSIFDTKKNT
ncbi:hypothetical protein AGMMS50268_30280 [Spirochaetia bacterium]|nr:hypothetical protein AGMMS50268_30280 [Spirochaetia bacterium]